MDIEDPPLFTGTIDWLVDGPPDLLFDEVATRGRIEEKLFVNSPEWRHQATIQLVRNVLRWGVIDLDDQGTDNSVLADHLFVTITLEATAPNGRDGLEISFGDSDWEPLGGIKRGVARIVNGASELSIDIDTVEAAEVYGKTVKRESGELRPEEFAALRESAAMMRSALEYLRRPKNSIDKK